MKDFLNKANEILEKGLDSAKKGAKVAGEKIDAFAEETKTRFSIVEKEKEVDKLLKELGSKIYRDYLNKKLEDKESKKICKEIDEKLKEKTKLENDVLSLKDLVICENCKNTIDINSTFCKYCGYPQEKEEEKEVKKENKTKKTSSEKVTEAKAKKAKQAEKKIEEKENKTKSKAETKKTETKKQPKVATIKLDKKTKEK